jgi:multiple sugar transport system ATP-binding protein
VVADVRLVEMLGSEMHVFFSIDAPAGHSGTRTASVAETEAGLLTADAHNGVARLDPRSPVRPGQRVTFRVDPERLHFFDPDTGAAIR